ncbi:MAG: OmpH family outer membrane protein [Tannerella sp.]|jgi:outer membrane protein|nr:OmpH family outer membrane protein [Tannerella sp.]
MKKFIALCLMMLPLSLVAQELKIAIVNTSELINLMPEVSAMEKQLADLNAQYEKELKIMQDDFNKKYSEYVAQQDSLTENIKLRRQQEIQDLQERIQNYVPVAQQEMEKKQQELFAPIQEKLQKAITAVGDEKGYTFIISPQVLLYKGNSAIDATQFVKDKLGIK